MAVAAGVISLVEATPTSLSLECTAASGGTGPYTYQWYKSLTDGFTPSGGNLISGATSLTLDDTGLIPGTTWFYVLRATDTGHSNDTADTDQFTAITLAPVPNQNQFAQSTVVGVVDQAYNPGTMAVQIDASQTGLLYAGQAVKMYDRAGGVPKVVACTADDDDVQGFINYDIKTQAYAANTMAQISCLNNVMWLYATAAIARGAKVQLDVTTRGGVAPVSAMSGASIVGYAMDKAAAAGDLIRVSLMTPYVLGNA